MTHATLSAQAVSAAALKAVEKLSLYYKGNEMNMSDEMNVKLNRLMVLAKIAAAAVDFSHFLQLTDDGPEKQAEIAVSLEDFALIWADYAL